MQRDPGFELEGKGRLARSFRGLRGRLLRKYTISCNPFSQQQLIEETAGLFTQNMQDSIHDVHIWPQP